MQLSIETVARALDLTVTTVERWIRQGRIPIQRLDGDAVFSRAALEKWALAHHLTFALGSDETLPQTGAITDGLAPAMQRGRVRHGIRGEDSAAVLQSLVAGVDFLSDAVKAELYAKLLEREQLASTGIGNGIAIPHPREPLSAPPDAPVITTCFADPPVPFGAIDDQPVFVFFLLISPTVKHHLHLLSRLSFCIRDPRFVDFLKGRPDAERLRSRVAEFEKQVDGHL